MGSWELGLAGECQSMWSWGKMSHNWNLCLHTVLQTNLDCYLKTLHVLMWEEEDLLGTLHLTVSNFSKKKECFCSAVVTCILWHSNVWYWQDLCDSLGADLSWWDWLTSDRAARGQETWSQRSVGSGGQRWLRRARSGGAKPDEPPNCHLPSFLFLFLWFQLLAGRAHWFQRGWVLDNW